MKIFKIRRK